MLSFKDVKTHYNFTRDDEERLVSLRTDMIAHTDHFMDAMQSWLLETKETMPFLADENRKKRIFEGQRKWFENLFSGQYDGKYYESLLKIGKTHVKFQVATHYMSKTVNIFRTSMIGVLNHTIDDENEKIRMIISINKILDINLDVITSAYIEEELRSFSPGYRVKTALITFSELFSQSMNFVLVIALMGLTLGVVHLFVYDVYKVIKVDLDHAVITALGSLLVMWIMIELMNTEIKHLKGGKFRISVFVGVALVAIIRDTMIMTLKHEQPEKLYHLSALILILGIVFWLVTRSEERSS